MVKVISASASHTYKWLKRQTLCYVYFVTIENSDGGTGEYFNVLV